MTSKTIYTTTLGLLMWLTSFGQTAELQKIDNELTVTFKKLIAANFDVRYDSLAPLFKKQLLLQLTNPVTFHNSLDSLSKYLLIKSSLDNIIKFYSWDDLTGGTWHNMTAIAQFISDNGKIVVQQLNSENETEPGEFTDSEIYEVNEITINNTKHYLTFGWGTHGSGQQHNIIQIFRIAGDKLKKCKSCFSPNEDLSLEYPRNEKLNLTFNAKTNEITYNEFIWVDEMGYYKRTDNIITLEFTKGKFTKK